MSFAYPEKKTPGCKWVTWLSNSARNCDKPCEKKMQLNAENSILEISASFITVTDTKISFTTLQVCFGEEEVRNFVCHGKNKY